MKHDHQLYSRPSSSTHVSYGRTELESVNINTNDLPILFWPDGRYCLEPSLYIHKLFDDGLSTLGGGGSLTTYAAYLTHLIRFCHQSDLDFINIGDARFTLFMRNLKEEQRIRSGEMKRCRNNTTTLKMGRFYLDFLSYVSKLHAIPGIVGTRIKAKKKKIVRRTPRGILSYEVWVHRSFPQPDEVRRRRPLPDYDLDSLFQANNRLNTSEFIRKRRYVTLLLFKITGARRMEIAMLKVGAIKEALESKKLIPMLNLPNVKQKGGPSTRKVPVSRGDLLEIEKYVTLARQQKINKTCGRSRDPGNLFISATTGQPLSPNSITAEFSLLAKEAGISGEACPHMLRHRYLVNLYIELLLEAGTRDKDQFQLLLYKADDLLMKLKERSGHASNSGIEWYITLAIERLNNLEGALAKAKAEDTLSSLPPRIAEIERQIALKRLSPEQALELYRRGVGQVAEDIAALMAIKR